MTRKTLAQIQSQIDKLQKEAEAIRAREVADVVGRIKEAIRHYGLSAADLGLDGKGGARGKRATQKAAADAPARQAGSAKSAKSGKPAKGTQAANGAKPAKPTKPTKGARVSVIKFADDQGHTWTGVGKRPNWYLAALAAGKTADDLRVDRAS